MTSALSDLDRIRAAFDAMTGPGLVALANVGYTQSDAQCSAVETLGGRGDDPQASSAIYWHAQSHDAFDERRVIDLEVIRRIMDRFATRCCAQQSWIGWGGRGEWSDRSSGRSAGRACPVAARPLRLL